VAGQKQGRTKSARYTIAFALALAAVWLGGASLRSLYHGTGEVYPGRATDTPAVAYAQHCTRVGPVSGEGFGYWWDCSAAVDTVDGRWADITTHRSMLTPADIGRRTNMIESCRTADHRDCVYGRPVAWDRAFTFASAILGIVERAAEIMLGFMLAVSLAFLIFGEAKVAAFARRRRWTKQRAQDPAAAGPGPVRATASGDQVTS